MVWKRATAIGLMVLAVATGIPAINILRILVPVVLASGSEGHLHDSYILILGPFQLMDWQILPVPVVILGIAFALALGAVHLLGARRG